MSHVMQDKHGAAGPLRSEGGQGRGSVASGQIQWQTLLVVRAHGVKANAQRGRWLGVHQ